MSIADDAHCSCWSDEICSLWPFDDVIITVCWLCCVFAIGWRKKTWWNTGVSEEQRVCSSVWRVRGGIREREKPSHPTEESTGIWTGGWGWGRRLILRWSSSETSEDLWLVRIPSLGEIKNHGFSCRPFTLTKYQEVIHFKWKLGIIGDKLLVLTAT